MKNLMLFLLRHTVLIVVFCFILVGIIYRGPIFGTKEALSDTVSTGEEVPSPPAEDRQQPGVEKADAPVATREQPATPPTETIEGSPSGMPPAESVEPIQPGPAPAGLVEKVCLVG